MKHLPPLETGTGGDLVGENKEESAKMNACEIAGRGALHQNVEKL